VKIQATERKKAKEEKDFLQLTRPFARLMNACDYDSFVETSLAETQLRERIAQLQEYRRYGITTFKAAEEFEAEKKQRLASVILRSPFAVTSERVFKQITAANGLQHVISPTTQKTSTLAGKQHVISDISGIESAEFLTDRERRLCVSHQILPRAYLSIKRAILKGGNRVSRAQSQLKTGKVARIIRFIKSESRDIH
jgi:transcriptional adapter 2-alpha